MVRQIIKIDDEKCVGCGLCVTACHEGAIKMVDGKAKLISDDYCDGLGNCLPVCPTNAITFEEREAVAFDITKIPAKDNKEEDKLPCGCPSTHSKTINHNAVKVVKSKKENVDEYIKSRLNQWPVQIKLVPVNAPYFNNCNLLIAADCTAYSYANFHNEFMTNKITLIGCPKLDSTDYGDKLTEILKNNEIKSITVVRMEVPCCSGIVSAVKTAMKNSDKIIPWQVVVVSTDGTILEM